MFNANKIQNALWLISLIFVYADVQAERPKQGEMVEARNILFVCGATLCSSVATS